MFLHSGSLTEVSLTALGMPGDDAFANTGLPCFMEAGEFSIQLER